MPDRGYIARRTPPSMGDRIRGHRNAFLLAAAGTVVGALLVAGGFSPSFDPSPSLAQLPEGISLLTGTTMLGGSALHLYVMLSEFPTRARYWLLQRISCGFQMLGWTAYTVAAMTLRPASLVPWIAGAMMLAAPGWEAIESVLEEGRIRRDRAGEGKPPT